MWRRAQQRGASSAAVRSARAARTTRRVLEAKIRKLGATERTVYRFRGEENFVLDIHAAFPGDRARTLFWRTRPIATPSPNVWSKPRRCGLAGLPTGSALASYATPSGTGEGSTSIAVRIRLWTEHFIGPSGSRRNPDQPRQLRESPVGSGPGVGKGGGGSALPRNKWAKR